MSCRPGLSLYLQTMFSWEKLSSVIPQSANALLDTANARGLLFFRHHSRHQPYVVYKMLNVVMLWAKQWCDLVTGHVMFSCPGLGLHEMKRCVKQAVCPLIHRVYTQSGHSPAACRALLWNNLQLFPTRVSRQNTSWLILHLKTTRPIWRRDAGAKLKEPFLYI